MRILAPGDVALVVGFEGDVDLLVVNAVTPVGMKILGCGFILLKLRSPKIFVRSHESLSNLHKLWVHYLCIF